MWLKISPTTKKTAPMIMEMSSCRSFFSSSSLADFAAASLAADFGDGSRSTMVTSGSSATLTRRISSMRASGFLAVMRSCLVAKVRTAFSTPGTSLIRSSTLAAQWAQSKPSMMYTFVFADAFTVLGTIFTSDSMEEQMCCISGSNASGSAARTRSCLVAKVMVASSTPGRALIFSSILEAQWAQPRFSMM